MDKTRMGKAKKEKTMRAKRMMKAVPNGRKNPKKIKTKMKATVKGRKKASVASTHEALASRR